ncbi:MAG TPA: hypothetical protein VNS52_07225 [Gemmatimonadaceae bacterium]|nr:hypothetical protein [Gemmatimonadaceae bacterium]
MISADTRARNPGASHFHGRRNRLTRLATTAPTAIARAHIIAAIGVTSAIVMMLAS